MAKVRALRAAEMFPQENKDLSWKAEPSVRYSNAIQGAQSYSGAQLTSLGTKG